MMREILIEHVPLALVGLLIVFSVQMIIALAISWMRQLDERWRHLEKKQTSEALDRAPTVDAITILLIAATAATILRGRHRIRAIRRLMPANAKRSPWSAQGRSILQGSHAVEKHGLKH